MGIYLSSRYHDCPVHSRQKTVSKAMDDIKEWHRRMKEQKGEEEVHFYVAAPFIIWGNALGGTSIHGCPGLTETTVHIGT